MKFFLSWILAGLILHVSANSYAQNLAEMAPLKQILIDQLPADLQQPDVQPLDFDIQGGSASDFMAVFYSGQDTKTQGVSSFLPHQLYKIQQKTPHSFTIILHPELYAALTSDAAATKPSNWLSVTSNLALAALFEAHLQLYDDLGLSLNDQSLRANLCDQAQISPNDLGTSRACRRLADRRKRYSDKDAFVQLGNLTHHPLTNADITQQILGQDSQTALLASYALFHMNPQFYCEWPGHWQFINQTFYGGAKQAPTCTNHLEQIFLDRTGTAQFAPDRVWKIEYLQAAPGHAEFISRFGHVMIGVIACAPEHTTPGPECEQDTGYHYVLTFSGEHVANLWQGLTGAGSSRLFVRDYNAFLETYAKEGRGVIHTTLPLSLEQKALFLGAALERTKYFVRPWNDLVNNCVNNTFSLLRASLPEIEADSYAFETPQQMTAWIKTWVAKQQP